ncbi:MAG: phosphatase PAP2 family protein [Marinirhabdus sp.]|nr:phosphatase PAP2 family protein [Marinirhabdus sp.]
MLQTLKEWDRELFVWLNGLGIERYDSIWLTITQIETWIPLFVVFFGLLFYAYGFKRGLILILFTILTFVITLSFTNLVKDSVARLRPNNVEALSDLIRILQKPTNYSFFSGHSSSSFAVTTFVVLSLKRVSKWIYLAYVWPLLFVMSRIYVGVHYPSDILVGAMVGTLFAILLHWLRKKLFEKLKETKSVDAVDP